jgi:beta-galactosidase/beta-glucuronidase
MTMPRPEYPRPQFVRRDWLNLNGEWQFEIDAGDSGFQRGLHKAELPGRILVPFCPESSLSGVGHLDFMNAVWYRRTVTIPSEWAGREVLLHFQAVDYDATIWVNGTEVGRHRGGFTPFACDLKGVVTPGEEATIVVRV